MKKHGISQETLKLIACITMLLDHIGAVFVPGYTLRIIGRVAFPIYCFLLAEGSHYTRNPKKYALRLAVGMVLSEIPFDMALFGGWTWAYQSVMVTLLLGFFSLRVMERCSNILLKMLSVLPFALLAEWLRTDYGGWGVVLIAMFGIVRGLPQERWLQLLGLTAVCWMMNSARIWVGNILFPIELFAVFAMVPIGLYSGRKATNNKLVQWGFYLFYPVHLTALWVISVSGILPAFTIMLG